MGYGAQQFDGPEDPHRSHNLWEPVPGDHGAHGGFDDRARSWSPQWWARKNAGWLALAAVAVIGALSAKAATPDE